MSVVPRLLIGDDGRPTRLARFVPTATAALFACLAVAGCGRSPDKVAAEPSPIDALVLQSASHDPQADARSRGREVFAHYCAICHGPEGKGDGFNSTNLAVPPRDFSAPEFWRQAKDERILLVVSNGGEAIGKSVLMPRWGRTLTVRQIHDVVAFLHTFAATAAPADGDHAGPKKAG